MHCSGRGDANIYAKLVALEHHECRETKRQVAFFVISPFYHLKKAEQPFSLLISKTYSWINMKIYEMTSQSR